MTYEGVREGDGTAEETDLHWSSSRGLNWCRVDFCRWEGPSDLLQIVAGGWASVLLQQAII